MATRQQVVRALEKKFPGATLQGVAFSVETIAPPGTHWDGMGTHISCCTVEDVGPGCFADGTGVDNAAQFWDGLLDEVRDGLGDPEVCTAETCELWVDGACDFWTD